MCQCPCVSAHTRVFVKTYTYVLTYICVCTCKHCVVCTWCVRVCYLRTNVHVCVYKGVSVRMCYVFLSMCMDTYVCVSLSVSLYV